MLINNLLYNILLILLAVSLAVGLIVLFKKKFNNYYGIILAIIACSMLCPFLYLTPGKLYVITKEMEVEEYRFFSSTEYIVGNKIEAFIVDKSKIFVINNSDKKLVFEEIIYGGRLGSPGNDAYSKYILPNTSAGFSLPMPEIDYLFDDEIPQQIEEYGSKGRVSKYRLHFAEEE